MRQPILVITGPSGAGKTTVGRLVAKTFGPSLHLRLDEFLGPFVVNGWLDPRLPQSAKQNDVIGAAAAAVAMELAAGGYTIVWDGFLFPQGLRRLVQSCAAREIALHYSVLRPDLDVCVDRATRRAADPDWSPQAVFADFDITHPTHRQAFNEVHGRFTDLGKFEANVIDASGPELTPL